MPKTSKSTPEYISHLEKEFTNNPSGTIACSLADSHALLNNLAECIKWYLRGLIFEEQGFSCAENLAMIINVYGKTTDKILLDARFKNMMTAMMSNSYPSTEEVIRLSSRCYAALGLTVTIDLFLSDHKPQSKLTAPAFRM